LTILTAQVTCGEHNECYNDVGICLWTNGSLLTQSAAQTACQQRNDSFLPRITNDSIQSKLRQFRSIPDALSLLHDDGFWIDVKSAGIGSWHWVDGSQLAGWFVGL